MRFSPFSERGASIVEATIILPFWIFLFLGATELFFFLNTYSAMSQVVREAVNSAAIAPHLSDSLSTTRGGPLNFPSDPDSNCFDRNLLIPPPRCFHPVLHQRVRLMLESSKARVVGGAYNSDISTRIVSGPPNRVRVELDADYESVFNLFDWGIHVSGEGPAL